MEIPRIFLFLCGYVHIDWTDVKFFNETRVFPTEGGWVNSLQ